MNYDYLGRLGGTRRVAFAASLSLATALSNSGYAQDDSEEDIFELSPFEVNGESNQGYRGTNTLAGSRLNTQMKDVASAVSVITKDFLNDTAATKVEELLVYTVNTEVAGQGGNFFGASAGDTGYVNRLLAEPHKSTRIRGLDSADLTRDFFLTDVPLDSYNIDGVDIQRGPNSVLFGLGSPAGIINYTLKSAMLSEDAYSTSFRVSDRGSFRIEADANKVVIPDVLALRLVGMHEKNEFEQEHKYEKADRVFASIRWTPKLGSDSIYTEFVGKYENGNITANRPRVLPPEDLLTPWFDPNGWNKATMDEVHANNLPNTPANKAARDLYMQGGPTGTWWDEPGLIFGDSDSDATGNGIADVIRQRGGSPWGGWISPGNFFQNASNSAHPAAQKSYYTNPDVLAAIEDYEAKTGRVFAGMPGWSWSQITDTSVFDYRKYSIEGPNSSQFNDFDTLALTFRQTYLDNRVGIEFAYDDQEYASGYENLIGGTQKISVDVNRFLRNGQPNPNLGRPYVVDNSDSNVSMRDRESWRATAFYKFDFADFTKSDSLLSKVMGSHIFTVVGANQSFGSLGYSYDLYGVDDRYPDTNNRLKAIHYLNMDAGANFLGSSSAVGSGIRGISAVQRPGDSLTAMVQGVSSMNLADWSIVNIGSTTEKDLLYTGASAFKDSVATRSFVWQSRFLNDTIVGLFGYRSDDYEKWTKPTAQRNLDGDYEPFDPEWTYFSGDSVNRIEASGINRTYGVMVHASKYIQDVLPEGFEFSVGYNRSQNFRPSEVGVNYWGDQLPAPSGKTEDYTLIVSALRGKVNLRATKYESKQLNATYRGTGPDNWTMKNAIVRAMNGMMTETWKDGKIKVGDQPTSGYGSDMTPEQWAADPASWTGRQNTTPEFVVNNWMFGSGGYDASIANTPLPAGWTVANHPELLEQPLRIRGTATSIDGPEVQVPWQADGEYFTQPPISPAEADYRAAWFAARSDEEWYRPFGQAYFEGLEFQKTDNFNWGFWDSNVPANLKNTTDVSSKGLEFELTVNPNDSWRIMLNASKQEASYTNLMPGVDEVFAAVMDVMTDGYDVNAKAENYWERDGAADIDFWGNNNGQRLQDLNGQYRNYLIGKQGENRPIDELKEWRYAVVTNYRFNDGRFKGFNVGGSMRWEDDGIIGYVPMYNAELGVWVSNLDKPFYSKSRTNYDLWAGYERKVFSDKVDWNVQLNVRDLFADDDLIPIRAQPDGTIASYRIPASTSLMLTNTFKF